MIQGRRSFSPEYKFSIIREHLIEHIPIQDISSKYLIHPMVVHRWKSQLFTKGAQVFVKRIKKSNKSSIQKSLSKKSLRLENNRIWMRSLLQGQFKPEILITEISPKLKYDEIELLYNEIVSKPLRYRNRALSILSYFKGISKTEIANFLLIGLSTVDSYISQFNKNGLAKYLQPGKSKYKKFKDKKYIDSVFRIIHAPPSAYGLNRTTYRIKDIQSIMVSEEMPISMQYISRITKDAGYHYRKAKKVLTSTDPNYRKKVRKIQTILSNLDLNEKFFSVDEFGPFAIKKQGGRSLVKKGETRIVPQFQKSKGSLIITGALELSTNQIIHFYSAKKNTAEMLKLLDLLIKKYTNEECIYFSWDAASWHASKELYRRVDEINKNKESGPLVKLAPLPSSAQFLNVIESVFSGMARAIIHNSDYQSVDECKSAIDRYFHERNEHFYKHPKRAGNKIWGKEREKPMFSESNNCKDPMYR